MNQIVAICVTRDQSTPNCSPRSLNQTRQDAYEIESGLSLINLNKPKAKLKIEIEQKKNQEQDDLTWLSDLHQPTSTEKQYDQLVLIIKKNYRAFQSTIHRSRSL